MRIIEGPDVSGTQQRPVPMAYCMLVQQGPWQHENFKFCFVKTYKVFSFHKELYKVFSFYKVLGSQYMESTG